ncbi:putative reverse transcriptase domain-containing protein [Tanacetum coccineum]
MSSSSFSSHVTVTYTSMSNDDDVPSWGIPLMDAYESDPEPVEAQPLPASVSPTTLSPDYSADSEPVEGDPEEHPEEDLEEEEELSALADSSLAGLYIDLPSKVEEDEVPFTPPSPTSHHHIIPLFQTGLRYHPHHYYYHHLPAKISFLRLTASEESYICCSILEEVNERVTDLAASHRHDSHEFYVRRPGLQGKQDTTYARQSWTQAMDYIRGLQAEIRVLQQQRRDDVDRKPKKSNMSATVIEELINQRVPDALADYETNQNSVNGNGSHDSGGGGGRTPKSPRVCTYKEFLNCQPLNFKGTEGAVGLAHWFKKMESVFHISNYTVECQVEKYTGGLPDSIQGIVMASKPTKLQEAIELARSLMAQKILTYATRQAENKRRMDNNSRNNHDQQPPYKRQNVARAYTVGPCEKREYAGTLPLCNKCKFHHNGSCAEKCTNYKRVGHLARDCRSPAIVNTQRASRTVQKTGTCFECGSQGHYKNDCPRLKNKNRGNAARNGEARGRAYSLGGGEPNPNSNVVTGTFLLNNRYASILFDTGADRSFMSTTFSSLIDIAPSTLANSYDIELADGRITGVNTIIRGCTLNLLNHTFNIDLMPVELGSFDVVIGMDWLSKYHVVIVCDEKTVRIPYVDEVLIVQGNKSDGRNESRLNIISCTKTQKYLLIGCHIFLARITKKKTVDKSEEK